MTATATCRLALDGEGPAALVSRAHSSEILSGFSRSCPGASVKGAFTIFAVYFVFAIARRYMSAASVKPLEAHISIADLTNRFGGTQWIVGISMVLVGVLFFFTTHAIFVWLNQYLAAADGPAEFTLWPQKAIWWFFPGFGALALSWEI